MYYGIIRFATEDVMGLYILAQNTMGIDFLAQEVLGNIHFDTEYIMGLYILTQNALWDYTCWHRNYGNSYTF